MTDDQPHEGFSQLVQKAKQDESEPVWLELLQCVLPELRQLAEEVARDHDGESDQDYGDLVAELITDTWLEVSRKIQEFPDSEDDSAAYAAFREWMAEIMRRLTRLPLMSDSDLGSGCGDPAADSVDSPDAGEIEEIHLGETSRMDYDGADGDFLLTPMISPDESDRKKSRGAAQASEPEPLRDDVHFAVFAPPAVRPRAEFLLSLWVFLDEQRTEMESRASQSGRHAEAGSDGPTQVLRGSKLNLYVTLDGFEIEQTTGSLYWNGEIATTSFAIRVPQGINLGQKTGLVRVLCHGWQIAQVRFTIQVGDEPSQRSQMISQEKRIRTVFASYARKDLKAVLPWIRGAKFAGIDAFFDVLSLREGDDWETKLRQEVPAHDLFCLFWSEAASRSHWVEKEWRCALESRGCEYIHPIPLCDPTVVPPPKELAACLHFDDLMRMVLDSLTSNARQSLPRWLAWTLTGLMIIIVIHLILLASMAFHWF